MLNVCLHYVYFIKAIGQIKPPHRDLLNVLIPKVADKWHELGIQLLDQPYIARLDQINKDYPKNVQKCCYEMLRCWLEVDTEATWCKIIQALKSPGVLLFVAAAEVEQELMGKH